MIVKIDRSEALAVTGTLMKAYIVTILSSLIVITFVSFIFSNAITHPIRLLVEGTKRIQK